jgi:hypothetical protein
MHLLPIRPKGLVKGKIIFNCGKSRTVQKIEVKVVFAFFIVGYRTNLLLTAICNTILFVLNAQ